MCFMTDVTNTNGRQFFISIVFTIVMQCFLWSTIDKLHRRSSFFLSLSLFIIIYAYCSKCVPEKNSEIKGERVIVFCRTFDFRLISIVQFCFFAVVSTVTLSLKSGSFLPLFLHKIYYFYIINCANPTCFLRIGDG